MNKTIKRIASMLLIISLTTGLSACGKSTSTSNTSNASKGEAITLKLWDIWPSDSNVKKKCLEDAIKEWSAANPNIKIETEGSENEAYKTKIKTAISANSAPDIFTSWGAGFSKPFVDSNKVLELDSYLKDGSKDRILPGSMDNVTYNNKIYGLPYSVQVGVFYVNKELFDKNNIKVPEKFSELLDAVKAFRAKSITPMTVGEKDRWPGMWYYDMLALREGGAKLSNDALGKNASYDDPAFINAAEKLNQLIDAKAFDNGVLGISRDESEVPFIQGKVPMYYTGNWLAGTVQKDNSPVKGKIVALKFPVIDGGKGNVDEFIGGAVDCFMVSANTPHKEEAVKAVKFIAESMAAKVYITGAGLPTWKVAVDESKVDPLNVQINNLVKNSKGYVLAWDTYLSGADAEEHKDLVAKIFGKAITPQDFGKQMQEKLNKK